MKKSFVILLSAGLVLYILFSSFTINDNTRPGPISLNGSIRHQVVVRLNTELSLCNTYMVQLLDQNRNQVALQQRFVPGISTYTFYERGPVNGLRVAAMVRSNYDSFICQQELFTEPYAIYGGFLNGKTYYYELDPQIVVHYSIK
jgi:hypothetical protein